MIGVSVKVRGTNRGAITDLEGRFSLNVTSGSVLEFTYMGYKKQTVTVGSRTFVEVTMETDDQRLDEVVVIGYGTVKKRDLTGAVVSIKGDEILETPTNNVMEALQGRIAGADIQMTSGAVGSNPEILLRGTRSIYGSNDPLFIIDGVQGASYDQLNPADIESIDILKDASSTAIYGSAGANGVIIITTKRGKAGKVSVNLDAYHGFAGEANFKHGMTGNEYLNYQREHYRTRHDGNYPTDLSQIWSSEAILSAIDQGKWIDWIDEISSGNATRDNINLSLTGGNEKASVFSSINYNKENGLLTGESQVRYGLRLNADYTVNKVVKIGMSSNVTYTNRDARGKNIFTKSLDAFPLGDVYDENGNINEEFIEGETTPLGDQMKDQFSNNTRSTYVNATGYIQLTPLKGLSLRSQLSGTVSDNRNGKYIGEYSLQGTENNYAPPYAYIANSYSYGYLWENVLTYDFDLWDDHHFTATGITSWSKTAGDSNDMRAQGQALDSYLFYNMAAGTEKFGVKSNYKQNQKMSYALRLNYSYKGRYIASFTTRWDGVSHLAEGHKWEAFPAGSVAWRVSDEPFMDFSRRWLSNLKLRAGYGVTGNSGGMGAYSSQTGASAYMAVSADGEAVPNNQLMSPYGNPAIGWEKSYALNVGIDLGLFNERVSLSADYYNTDTKDLLFQRKLPITSALTAWGSPLSMWQNIGETNNRGWEIQLRSTNIETKDFSWESTLSFTRNREKIVSLPDGDLVASKLFEGHPIKTFYDYKYLGIWSEAEADEAAKYGCQPGFVKIATVPYEYVDENGNQVNDGGLHEYSDTKDKQILGSNVPDGILGFNNKFRWRDFELSFFLMMRWGQMIESDLIGWYNAGGNNQPAGTKYWTPERQDAYFPRPGITQNTGVFNSYHYIDASYAKLKNITVAYNLPKKWLHRLGVQRARIYATAYNTLVFPFKSELKDTDPENNGSDTFPLYASYVVGVNLSF